MTLLHVEGWTMMNEVLVAWLVLQLPLAVFV